jgi:predicted GIY-YIG superfamily endonuclease
LNTWWVYIVEKRKKFYVGITTDLANRMRQHGNPQLLYKEGPMKREEAVSRERTLKGWSSKKKLELIDSGVIKAK